MSATELYGSGEYLRRNPDWHESDAKWKARKVETMLSRHGLVPRSVCDIGCGTGGVLSALAEAPPPRTELVGFEISADALRHVSAERRRRVNFVQTLQPSEMFRLMSPCASTSSSTCPTTSASSEGCAVWQS
ncbi:MAG: class I SAM-dependent methyltransferase, partial [Actinomycetota bacterium]|nr:class I SAM-dependent methyltransferase [Actinomycetota bacterium]